MPQDAFLATPRTAAISFRRLLRIDWDVIAGISAALVAMLLSFMSLVSETVGSASSSCSAPCCSPATVFGEVRWFNVCCRMFRRPEVFDTTLRVFLDNPHVTSIPLICRPEERAAWETDLLPKLRRHPHGMKVHPPLWGPIKGGVSFVLGDVDGDGRNEALLAIMDEPFATTANRGPAVPRFTFRVYNQSELLSPLEELVRHATSDFEINGSEQPAAASAPRSAQPPAS